MRRTGAASMILGSPNVCHAWFRPLIGLTSVIRHMKPWTKKRLIATVPALVLGWGIFLWFGRAYARYWVLRDGTRGMALVTAEGDHATVYYTYSAAGTRYSGRSHRDWEDARHRDVGVGERAPVWYSRSHPWLSSLPRPRPTLYGFPWVLAALAFEALFVVTMVAPRSGWALNLG
jgi:hypothetical protein